MLFVPDLWRGKLRLWITYWICGVAGNMSLVALFLLVFAAEGAAAEAFLGLVDACSLAWFVLIFGGIWRAARRYPRPPIWGVLARLGALVGAMRMAGEAALRPTRRASSSATRLPDNLSSRAVVTPAMPPPTTATSTSTSPDSCG